MSSKEFIFQGFTERTHIEALNELFHNGDIEQVILSVAFITESGIDQIHNHLLKNKDKLLVLAGIRNDITSYQGLLKLSKIGGTLYAVDTGFKAVVFHPKIYLVRGKHVSKMLIGSANLTLGGLNNNIEAGMYCDAVLSSGFWNGSAIDRQPSFRKPVSSLSPFPSWSSLWGLPIISS